MEPHDSGTTGKTGDVRTMEIISGVLGGKSLHPHTRSKLERKVVHTSLAETVPCPEPYKFHIFKAIRVVV
jgi:hypothetical protein